MGEAGRPEVPRAGWVYDVGMSFSRLIGKPSPILTDYKKALAGAKTRNGTLFLVRQGERDVCRPEAFMIILGDLSFGPRQGPSSAQRFPSQNGYSADHNYHHHYVLNFARNALESLHVVAERIPYEIAQSHR